MNQAAVSYEVDQDQVNGVIVQPSPGEAPYPAVLVCHPHPLFGGDMNSSVVVAICAALAEHGIASLRFNFRNTGDGETLDESSARDVESGLQLLDEWEMVNSVRLGVVGYSFGAAAMARASDNLGTAKAFAFVAPPVSVIKKSSLGTDPRPRYFLVGGRDRLVNPEALSELVSGMNSPTTFETLDGADHMLAGYEKKVAKQVADFMASKLLY
ncbi:MAG: alpha/beta family hydrolase [Dehalococcoidia bacterium]